MGVKHAHKVDRRKSLPVLNRLLALQEYSLANYVLYAPPWTPHGEEPLLRAVRRIATEQQAQAARIYRLLERRRGYVEPAQFPVEFTAYTDVSLDYLAERLIENERQMIDEIRSCVEQLARDPPARQLAETILANEARHLQLLTDLPRAGEIELPAPNASLKTTTRAHTAKAKREQPRHRPSGPKRRPNEPQRHSVGRMASV
jgi:hypothetical protein